MAANKSPNRTAVGEMYRQGFSARECGERHNLSAAMVCRIIRQDFPELMRKRGGRQGCLRQHSEVTPDATGSALEKLFSYDPQTGIFTHRTWRGPRSRGPGSVAGCRMQNGYIVIGLPGGGKQTGHRLAWLWMTGKWPPAEIDHINGDRSDNCFSNLRKATRVQNCRNGGIRCNNSTGHVGVAWDASRRKYTAKIGVAGLTINLGRFVSLDEAVSARCAAEIKHFGEFRPDRRAAFSVAGNLPALNVGPAQGVTTPDS